MAEEKRTQGMTTVAPDVIMSIAKLTTLGIERTDTVRVLSFTSDFYGNTDVLDIAMPMWGGSLDVQVVDVLTTGTLIVGENQLFSLDVTGNLGDIEIDGLTFAQADGFTATDGIGNLEVRSGATSLGTATLNTGVYTTALIYG